MDILDRYLLKEFLVFLVLIWLGLAVVFLGVDLFSNLWRMSMGPGRFLSFYAYKVPSVLQQFTPVACLMALLLVLTNMSRQNEILALYTSGVGMVRLISTFVAAVAVISTLSFLTFDYLVPALTKKQWLIERGLDPSQEDQMFNTESGFWFRNSTMIYNFGRFSPETATLEGVNVYKLTKDFTLARALHAKSAQYRDSDWTLKDGFTVDYLSNSPFPLPAAFKTLRGVIPDKPGDFKALKLEDDTMRLKDLRRYIKRNRGYGLDTTAQQVRYQERVALVFTPLIFTLLGIPFAVHPLRSQSTPKSLAFCFGIVFLYLLMHRMSLSIGKGGHIPPVFAAWTPNIVFLALALFFISKK